MKKSFYGLLTICIVFFFVTVSAYAATDPLPSWNDGPSKQAVIGFVVAVTTPGSPDFMAKEERIATFDSDGTLMSEQPVYFQFLYEIYRVRILASKYPAWQTLQPFKAAMEGDLAYLAHSASPGELDLTAGTEAGRSDEETRADTAAWAAASRHPRFNRPITDLVYQPMLELLNYLRVNGFKTYVVTGTGIEFIRAWAEKTYGVPPEMIVGSSIKARYQMRDDIGSMIFEPSSNFICNGDDKPTAIHYMIGRRPIAAFGNSDSDIPMLQYATSGKGRRLGLLVHHTDDVREWAYDRGSRVGNLDKGFDEAARRGWVVVDMKKDWKVIFPFEQRENVKKHTNAEPKATDYSKSAHWLSLPVATDKKVDVFYLYPTAWKKVNATDSNICEIDNASMATGSKAAFGRQATAFETVGNIYAPYYRQADLSPVDREKVIGGIPTLDAIAAFEYYIKHYNNGRPFILAGHSQGSNVLSKLLAGYIKENPDVNARMVAAYVIGYPITAAYLADNPHLKFAEGPDDTGVIISYNTQSPDVLPGTNMVLSGMVGLVINPISWTRGEALATKDKGLGSLMPNPKTLEFLQVPQYADAKIDKTNGVLICSTADENTLYKLTGGALGLGKGVYHSFDYLFYYYNLRANAANRATKFLSK